MTPNQFYFTVAMTPALTLVVVLIGILINNSRLNDLKDVMRAFNDRQDANLRRVEDMLLHKFAELDTRLTRIEQKS